MVRGYMRLVERSHEVRYQYPLLVQQIVQIMIFMFEIGSIPH